MTPIAQIEAKARAVWNSNRPVDQRAKELQTVSKVAETYLLRNKEVPIRLAQKDIWAAQSMERALQYLENLNRDIRFLAATLESGPKS